MSLENNSSYPIAELERLIEFAARMNTVQPIRLDEVCVHVKNTSGRFSGVAFDAEPPEEWCGVNFFRADESANYFVVLRIPSANNFPQSSLVRGRPYGGRLSPVYSCHNWQECVVALAAHEFHHVGLWQRQTGRCVVHSEAHCERQAIYALHRLGR
jgi:hypothetical protein